MDDRNITGGEEALSVERVKALTDAFNEHDVDAIMAFFDDDCEWIMARGPEAPHGRRCQGKEEIRKVLSSRFRVIPDMRWIDTRHWVVGNKGFSEWTVQGTPRTGERLDFQGCDLWEFRNGKLVKKDTYWKLVE